jgi:tetratricopeptide (TPR) repeat protein
VYFEPDATKAKYCYDVVYGSNKIYDIHHPTYRKQIRDLKSLLNLEFSDVIRYRNYINGAIRYKAYGTSIQLLFNLNTKFPNDSKIVSRLGKTLCNKAVGRIEEGRVFIKQAIELFKKENDKINYEKFILYYLNGLLNNEYLELLSEEVQQYGYDLKLNVNYFIFIANYYRKLGKSEDEIIKIYKEAISIVKTKGEKVKAVESLLRYLTILDDEKHKTLFEEMKMYNFKLMNEISLNNKSFFV